MTNYLKMSAPDMLSALGDDAHKWAQAYRELRPDADEETLVGWFANAIENSHDVRIGRLIHDDQAWLDFIDRVTSQRRFMREIRDGEC